MGPVPESEYPKLGFWLLKINQQKIIKYGNIEKRGKIFTQYSLNTLLPMSHDISETWYPDTSLFSIRGKSIFSLGTHQLYNQRAKSFDLWFPASKWQ